MQYREPGYLFRSAPSRRQDMSRLISFVNQYAFVPVDHQLEAERRFHDATLRIGVAHRSWRVAFNRQNAALRQRITSQGHICVHCGVNHFPQRCTARVVRIDDAGRPVAGERLTSHGDYADRDCYEPAQDYCGLRMTRFDANGDRLTTPSTASNGSHGLPN